MQNQNKAAAAPSTSANIDMVKRPRVDGAGGEQVASVVANMNPADVYHIVQQTKQAVDANPEQVGTEIFTKVAHVKSKKKKKKKKKGSRVIDFQSPTCVCRPSSSSLAWNGASTVASC